MQKIVSLLFSGLCAFAFASFGQKCPPPAAPVTIQATIVRVQPDSLLLVESGAGASSAMTLNSQNIAIYDASNHPITIEDLHAGQLLEICYNGQQLNTFPSELSHCEYLRLTGEETDVSELSSQLQGYLPHTRQDSLPTLSICYGTEQQVTPLRGTSHWQEGEEALCQYAPHPLAWQPERMRSITLSKDRDLVHLAFTTDFPHQLTVTRWPLTMSGDLSHQQDGEVISVKEKAFQPQPDSLYEVTAVWPQGQVSWAFATASCC